LLVDKAKNRLISYQPIRSALHTARKKQERNDDIRELIKKKAGIVNIVDRSKFEEFANHESIKF